MPGDPVVAFAPSEESERLVAALADLAARAPVRFVLVGGLAVAARLETFHRSTQDLDAVVNEERSRFQRLTVEAVTSAALDAGHLTVAGVPVDIIEIDAATPYDSIAELIDPLDRIFTAGHLFAYGDVSSVVLRAGKVRATVEVATARALLVAKLHAYLAPRRDRRKHPSDASDILELGRLLVSRDLGAYDDVPAAVVAAYRWGVEQLAAHPAEMVRRLALPGMAVDSNEVTAMASLLLDEVIVRDRGR